MLRNAGSVLAGYVLWSLLWVGMNAVLLTVFPEFLAKGQPVTSDVMLAGLLAWSTACSLLAGFVTSRIAMSHRAVLACILGLLLLATGMAVQHANADLMPVWYHVSFLMLLLPATMAGACVAKRRAA